MSQIIVDEHLGLREVLLPIRRWITAQKVESLKPGEVLKDDRLLQVLTHLNKPTLITIDEDFWDRRYLDRRYCLLYFALPEGQQRHIPILLRRLLRLRPFKTKAARMGKVARITFTQVSFWQLGSNNLCTFVWLPTQGRSSDASPYSLL